MEPVETAKTSPTAGEISVAAARWRMTVAAVKTDVKRRRNDSRLHTPAVMLRRQAEAAVARQAATAAAKRVSAHSQDANRSKAARRWEHAGAAVKAELATARAVEHHESWRRRRLLSTMRSSTRARSVQLEKEQLQPMGRPPTPTLRSQLVAGPLGRLTREWPSRGVALLTVLSVVMMVFPDLLPLAAAADPAATEAAPEAAVRQRRLFGPVGVWTAGIGTAATGVAGAAVFAKVSPLRPLRPLLSAAAQRLGMAGGSAAAAAAGGAGAGGALGGGAGVIISALGVGLGIAMKAGKAAVVVTNPGIAGVAAATTAARIGSKIGAVRHAASSLSSLMAATFGGINLRPLVSLFTLPRPLHFVQLSGAAGIAGAVLGGVAGFFI